MGSALNTLWLVLNNLLFLILILDFFYLLIKVNATDGAFYYSSKISIKTYFHYTFLHLFICYDKLTIAVCSLLATVKVNAQNFKFGAKGGFNFSTVKAEGVSPDYRTSIHLGLVAECKLSDKISMQPELLYSGQGAAATFYFETSDYVVGAEGTLKLSYLNVPVMFKYDIGNGLNLQAGPQLGILLDSKFGVEDNDLDADGIQSIDFGFDLGLGYKINDNFFVDARYNLGLTNVSKITDNGRNHTFQLSIGYMF